MGIFKGWDWTKNQDDYWLTPCPEIAYLSERWQSKQYSNFLDLGSGLGRHSIYMAKKNFTVTAMDISDYGIDLLQSWANSENVNVSCNVANMLDLPYKDHSFDCILAYNVIYHTDTNGFLKSLKEIERVLKPKGELFITLLSKNTYSYMNIENYKRVDDNTILRDEHETEKNVPHFYVDIDDIKQLFKNWNFEISPTEYCTYDLKNSKFFSKHWQTLVSKKQV